EGTQDKAAVKELQKQHPDKASYREQSPEPGHGSRTGRLRIVAVVPAQELGNPVGRTLFRSRVKENAEEIKPDHASAQQRTVHAERSSRFFLCPLYLREGRKQQNPGKNREHHG